jgi:hypothetical protein
MMAILDDLTLEQMNWEICMANLQDAIDNLHECRIKLEKALGNISEMGYGD